jgi:hypothetical protein
MTTAPQPIDPPINPIPGALYKDKIGLTWAWTGVTWLNAGDAEVYATQVSNGLVLAPGFYSDLYGPSNRGLETIAPYYGNSAPVNPSFGQIWVNTTNPGQPVSYIWHSPTNDPVTAQWLKVSDGVTNVYVAPATSAPDVNVTDTGDTWYDTTNSLYYINSGAGVWSLIGGSGTSVTAALPTTLGTVFGQTPATDTSSVSLGYTAGAAHTGLYSTLVGSKAGDALTTSNGDTAIGSAALSVSTNTGGHNIAVGSFAASNLATSSSSNVIIGSQAGSGNLTGNTNVMVGYAAGSRIFTGSHNVLLNYAGITPGSDTVKQNLDGSVVIGCKGIDSSGNPSGLSFTANNSGAWGIWSGSTSGGAGGAAAAFPNDVDFGVNGQVLSSQGPSAPPKWINPSAGGATVLNDLTDVNTPSPTDGQVLQYNTATTSWVPYTLPGTLSTVISDNTDVDTVTTPPVDDDRLTWDAGSSNWVPVKPSVKKVTGIQGVGISEGDLQYDNTTNQVFVYDGVLWKILGSTADVTSTDPGTGNLILDLYQALKYKITTAGPTNISLSNVPIYFGSSPTLVIFLDNSGSNVTWNFPVTWMQPGVPNSIAPSGLYRFEWILGTWVGTYNTLF